jgi:carboxypeptidase Q
MSTALSRLAPTLLLVPALLLAVAAPAPSSPPPAGAEESSVAGIRSLARRLSGELLQRGDTMAALEELCRVAPRRLSGSASADRAVEWAERTMRELGLENVRREAVTVPRWVRGERERLVVVEPSLYAGQELPILALGGSIGTPTRGITAEVVRVTGFPELDALGREGAEGRIVLYDTPMQSALLDPFAAYGQAVQHRSNGAANAAALGAVASITRSMTTRVDDHPHTGGMRYREGVERIPAVALSTAATDRVSSWLAKGERVVVRLELDCRTEEPVESANVIGEVIGRELPEEIVLVGGHLDSWDVGPGAHDDGAGSCHALIAAATLKRLDLRPRRTIRVVLFMNEENGLAGGRDYHARVKDELETHVMALESDRGGFAPRGFSTAVEGKVREDLAALVEGLSELGAGRLIMGGGGADISPLARDGVLAVGFVPDPSRYFDFHHTTIDSPENVNPRELELGTAAIATLIHTVADLEARIDGKPPLTDRD